MQTIIEAANEFARLQCINQLNEIKGCVWEATKEAMMFNAFIKGVEFAQQWIKVEDELPTSGRQVLVKLKDNSIRLAYINCHQQFIISMMNNDGADNITHWRLVNIK